MPQQARPQVTEQEVRPGPPPPAPMTPLPRQVRVIAGADVQDMDLAGRTVGDARTVAQALFGIAADAVALIDGQRVDDAQRLGEGQLLEFVKHAGRKGAGLARSRANAPAAGPVIEVSGDLATWRRNGRPLGTTTVNTLLTRIHMAGQGVRSWHLYPRLVRLMVERRGGEVMGVVIEMPPGPRQVRWIADDATDPLGADGRYEERQLSFPWVVLVIVFVGGELSNLQQAFYRNAPIESLDDALGYTNLLNVAKGYEQDSWVCLVNLRNRLAALTWEQRVRAVTEHFWQAAFNRSSEMHEGNSFWGSLRKVDRRFTSPATWEAATRAHPYFALEVQWRRTGQTLGETLAGMLDKVAPYRPIERVEQLVTLMQQEES